MSGRHTAIDEEQPQRRRRTLIPILIGAAVATVVVGSAVAAMTLRPAGSGDAARTAASAADDRSTADRADRGDVRTDSSPSPSASEATQPSTVAPSTSPTKAATKSPTRSPTGGAVVGSGTCGTSYYATGKTTANGEPFDPNGLTAAHKTLPFNTRVKVTNVANGKSVVVRINDRGPFVSGRCLDLARGAFVTIASISSGVITARYEVLG